MAPDIQGKPPLRVYPPSCFGGLPLSTDLFLAASSNGASLLRPLGRESRSLPPAGTGPAEAFLAQGKICDVVFCGTDLQLG
jgi:hypothetical protein